MDRTLSFKLLQGLKFNNAFKTLYMKAASVKELKEELAHYSQKDLIAICLRLSKFKKENKELLTYLVYESNNEAAYIESVKAEVEQQFSEINTKSYYFIKKSVRKILRNTKKYIRYSQEKETEVELLLFFCQKLKNLNPSINRSKVLKGIYSRQLEAIRKATLKLHEDLQYDYEVELSKLQDV